MNTRAAGARWETRAAEELSRAGLTLVARNWHCRYGELDLIMREGQVLVFVEVRYRDAGVHGDGMDSIGPAKRQKLVRSAQLFLAAHPAYADLTCRFDVIAYAADADPGDWRPGAFDAF